MYKIKLNELHHTTITVSTIVKVKIKSQHSSEDIEYSINLLKKLSIVNKESRNIPTPTVIRQRHPTVKYPVNISPLKWKGFYAIVVSCLNTACKEHTL